MNEDEVRARLLDELPLYPNAVAEFEACLAEAKGQKRKNRLPNRIEGSFSRKRPGSTCCDDLLEKYPMSEELAEGIRDCLS